jgi:uncharacterized domain 1
MTPVRERLAELIGDDRVTVLENTRFNPGETKNDPAFARELAAGCDLFVNDAFGSAHRAHSSTVGVAELLPAYAGLLLLAELEHLGKLLGDVERPFVIVSGGAKVEDKVGVLENLGGRADEVLIGGKMAEDVRTENPFSFDVVLPTDVVAAASFDADAESQVTAFDSLPDGWLGLDIGPATREDFARRIAGARTVFWNGPMGVFEWPRFARGRRRSPSRSPNATASRRRRRRLGARGAGGRLAGRISWISTGGGAVARAAGGQGAARRRGHPLRMTELVATMPFAERLGVQVDAASPEEVRGGLDWHRALHRRRSAARRRRDGARRQPGAICAYLNLPAGATTATLESKTNFFRAVRGGRVSATSRPLHVGRSSIVVQTDVADEDAQPVALVIQTQAVLT